MNLDRLNEFTKKNILFTGEILSGDKIVANVINDEVIPIDRDRIPLFFIANNSFREWIKSRSFDSSRTNVRLLKKILNIRSCEDIDFAIKFHAISLTDNYWCRLKNERKLKYEDVSSLDDRLHRSALFGEFNENPNYNTPEISNLGSFEKCWVKENDNWYLKKIATDNELFSEIFVYRLCKNLKLPAAEYTYDTVNDCVSSKRFISNKYNLEEMKNILGDNDDFEMSLEVINTVNPKLTKQFLDILFIDAICYNFDRHTGNYGFIRNGETGEIVSMAPNYDNNNSLISREIRESVMAPKLFLDNYKSFLDKNSYDYPFISNELVIQSINETINEIGRTNRVYDYEVSKYVKDFVLNNYDYLLG